MKKDNEINHSSPKVKTLAKAVKATIPSNTRTKVGIWEELEDNRKELLGSVGEVAQTMAKLTKNTEILSNVEESKKADFSVTLTSLAKDIHQYIKDINVAYKLHEGKTGAVYLDTPEADVYFEATKLYMATASMIQQIVIQQLADIGAVVADAESAIIEKRQVNDDKTLEIPESEVPTVEMKNTVKGTDNE